MLGAHLLLFRQIVDDIHTRKLRIELPAAALAPLMRRDSDALRSVLGGLGERFGFVEEPGLAGVALLSRRLLGGAAEQLRLQPAVLFLHQLQALLARCQPCAECFDFSDGRDQRGGICHARKYIVPCSRTLQLNTEKCSASCGFIRHTS